MRNLVILPTFAAVIGGCDPFPREPPTTTTTTTATTGETTTTTTGETTTATTGDRPAETTGGCYPHFVPFGPGHWACFCDALMVDPAECGCTFGESTCACPSYPCEEHPCEMPCAPDESGAFCECGTLVAPLDPYCS